MKHRMTGVRDHIVEQIAQFEGWNLVERDNKAKVGEYKITLILIASMCCYRCWSSRTDQKQESEFGIVQEQLVLGDLLVDQSSM